MIRETLTLSALIAAVLLVRAVFKNRVPKRMIYALWLVVLLKLCMPGTLFSLPVLPAEQTAAPVQRAEFPAQTAPVTQPPAQAVQPQTPAQPVTQEPANPAAKPLTATQIFRIIWFSGSALLGLWMLGSWLVFTIRLRKSRKFLGRHGKTSIYVSSRIPSPCLAGLIPAVYLTRNVLQNDTTALILRHELTHLRHLDPLWSFCRTAAVVVYWWNPLVWLMVWLANRDMELACDEAVLRALGPDCRKAYALTLLDMAQRNPKSAPLCSGFAKSSAEERIRAILSFKRIPAWVGICVSVLFVLTASVFTTQAVSPAAVPEPEPAVQEEIPEENVAVSMPVSEPLPTTPPIMPEQEAESEIESETQTRSEVPAYIFPLEDANAEVTNPYGWQEHPVTKQKSLHSGVDLAADYGTNVLAVADGTVLDCSYDAAYGYILTLEHENGVQTQYAHLSEFLVEPGDTVQQGQIIAKTGDSGWSTGPHLHLGVLIDGEAVDPLEALKSES